MTVKSDKKNLLRQLPAIDKLLLLPEMQELQECYARPLVTEVLRSVVADIRDQILQGNIKLKLPKPEEYAILARQWIEEKTRSPLRAIVNATGTVTHTNLGRALLSSSACESLQNAAQNYVNLEYDLETGKRGHRDRITEPLLQQLTGCEASTVVNNNAAAVLIALQTVAKGREVIVSRGELIEIGGAFRIPDVMTASGAILREVGTTNRTHLRDYAEAINENTALILKVHPSNYKVVGFTTTPEMQELTELGTEHGIPTMEDLGSGALVDLSTYRLPHEPVVADKIEDGVDIVTFSGDKLLGGPQAGIIVGKAEWILQIRKNPLMRALRVDKLTIAALSATLLTYLNPDALLTQLPMLHRYTRSIDELHGIAKEIADRLKIVFAETITVEITETHSQIGSGSLPVETLPSVAVVLNPLEISAEKLAEHFRRGSVPIIGRIENDQLWFDVRTLYEKEQKQLIEAAAEVASKLGEVPEN
ncbi:MAG: L-seryl-tRNA(Sec) selenium transferase [Candidatus Poribacteria bacterium]|nr:L-seryl-tRNA(Sec) selenium transferase [Candidatus Poribacteria bacterium]